MLKYCTKRLSFSYKGLYARTQLAVLDHNSGIARKQATKKDGTPRVKTQFTKITDQWVAKNIRERKDKTYVIDILNEIKHPSEASIRENKKMEEIPQNIAPSENPGREELLKQRLSSFDRTDS